MKFWDSSAIVPIVVAEEMTGAMIELLEQDRSMLVWWGAEVEVGSVLARLERDADLTTNAASAAFRRLDMLRESWNEIAPVDPIRETARRFLRVHDLRPADALQLSAAFLAGEGRPASLAFVCLDDRLAQAAQQEGFDVFDRDRIKAGNQG